VLERSEKQALLAKQAQRLLVLLDDTPIVPGQERAPFGRHEEVREVINDAESELRAWTPSWQHSSSDEAAQEQDEQTLLSPQGQTGDGSHLAEAASVPLPPQTHAELRHDPTASSTVGNAGVPSVASEATTAVEREGTVV
jgi:hypothetical protein